MAHFYFENSKVLLDRNFPIFCDFRKKSHRAGDRFFLRDFKRSQKKDHHARNRNFLQQSRKKRS